MSSHTPYVSVITATYNWSSVLHYSIQSVLWQTFQDFELLVIGDGCTDDSQEVVASFGDERVRWHNLPENSGSQSIPNNKGLEMARGEYVAYLGHDDIWHPRHLTVLIEAMQENDADLGHTLTEIINPPNGESRFLRGRSTSGQLERNDIPPPSAIMHKRSVVEVVGNWQDHRTLYLPPDIEFVLRVWDYRQKTVAVNALTVFKFPAFYRKNSYIEKPSSEQAEYTRRISAEPDFLERELLAVANSYALGRHKLHNRIKARYFLKLLFAPPGAGVEAARKFRGLKQNKLQRPGIIHLWHRVNGKLRKLIH